jgi:hypothetical protein
MVVACAQLVKAAATVSTENKAPIPTEKTPVRQKQTALRELLTEDAGLEAKIAAAADGIMQEVIRDSAVAALGVRTHDAR